jgi:two-component system LytT family response regulator
MNVLLVDDEALARRRLRRLLADADDVTVVAECGSGGAAIEALRTHQVDLVFLDIQMPGVDGFVVAESLQGPEAPLLVFVTAHDTHAIRAFETRALDYLLKPVRRSGSSSPSDRRARRSRDGAPRRTPAARSVIAQLDSEPGAAALTGTRRRRPPNASRCATAERVRFVATTDVAWAEAKGPHVLLHTKQGVFEIRDTLARLERRSTRDASCDSTLVHREPRARSRSCSRGSAATPCSVLHGGQQLKVSRPIARSSASGSTLSERRVRGSGVRLASLARDDNGACARSG